MTIMELREKRNKAWEAAKAFVETKRDKDGLLSAEDAASYAEMEQKIKLLLIPAEQKKVWYVPAYVSPIVAYTFVAINFKISQRVIAIEIDFQRFIFNQRQNFLRQKMFLQTAVETVRQIVVGLVTFGMWVWFWITQC